MSISSTRTPSDELSKLWKEAIDQYISEAKLSEKEQSTFAENHKPEEVLDIVKTGWKKNITENQREHHETAVVAVSRTLAVLNLITGSLSLTV
jgi:hypothetical protein